MANKYWSKRHYSSVAVISSFTALLFLLLFLFGSSHNTSNNNSTIVRRVLRSSINHGRELSNSSLEIRHENKVVIMNNGVVELTLSNPGGDVIGINYSGIHNLLENRNKNTNRGYWDIVWGEEIEGDDANHYDNLQGTKFKIITQDEDHIEISFSRKWSNSSGELPLSVDKRYVMLRDYPGYYTYGIFSHPKEAPAVEIGQIRVAFKLKQDKFEYMAVSDDQQRIMPSAKDRKVGQALAYPEAVLLTNTSNPQIQGEVDDKYQYSMDHKDRLVHGWISSNPAVGFWVITASQEFLTGGPTKQELTSHAGPVALSMFSSCHYVGKDMAIKLDKGESWKKVFGPTPIYLNSVPNNETNIHKSLWENAKLQAQEEASKWPYNFTESSDLPSSDQRGIVTGQLLVSDRYINESIIEAKSSYVGLAAPGEAGSWQTENKGYQFWVKADEKGNFTIKDIRPGKYNLYAFVPGIIGDYVYENVTIEPGSKIELENLVYKPPRNGPTLWEIGVPDRTAAEYYIPDPLPSLENKLYVNKSSHKYRQYGLWDRFTDLYPDRDLIYTVNRSDYRRDWFFAHVNRKVSNGTYRTTTWQVRFDIENVAWDGSYTLQIALASATNTHLQVRMNDVNSRHPLFSTHLIGRDNSIARHGIHGLYRVFTVEIPSYLVREGNNTLFLSQLSSNTPFAGLFYDYIRFEAPNSIV